MQRNLLRFNIYRSINGFCVDVMSEYSLFYWKLPRESLLCDDMRKGTTGSKQMVKLFTLQEKLI